jgi:hypothetical protein
MSEDRRELSGAFTSPDRWSETWQILASPEGTIQQLRITHNTPQQLIDTCQYLSKNTTVTSLEVGTLDLDSGAALALVLEVSSFTPCLTGVASNLKSYQDLFSCMMLHPT